MAVDYLPSLIIHIVEKWALLFVVIHDVRSSDEVEIEAVLNDKACAHKVNETAAQLLVERN